MPLMDLDKTPELREAIKFIWKGKEYIVPDMKQERMNACTDAAMRMDADSPLYDAKESLFDNLCAQLSTLTDLPAATFADMDMREIVSVVGWIKDQMTEHRRKVGNSQKPKR